LKQGVAPVVIPRIYVSVDVDYRCDLCHIFRVADLAGK